MEPRETLNYETPRPPTVKPARPLEVLGIFIAIGGVFVGITAYVAGDTEKVVGGAAVIAFGVLFWLLAYIAFLRKRCAGR